ncbi:MAG: septum site-determining protein MinC [Anaerolineae bacterium]
MANDSKRVTIKGTSDGLIITLGAGDWGGLLETLNRHLGQKASFFKGGRVALHVGPRQLDSSELMAAGELLDRNGVTLWAVIGDSPETRRAAAQLGLETRALEGPSPLTPPPEREDGNAIVIRKTLRSGQLVEHPGHVVVIGDVNPGAEIRAGGDVVVWGRLRGVVHAGLAENEEAVVCALLLTPTQLRIGQVIARSPADASGEGAKPEMAFVQDGQIVAQAWK